MATIGRPPSCLCGECVKCKRRVVARAKWQAMTPAERQAQVARRDPERKRASDRARYYRDRDKRLELAKRLQRENPDWHKKAIDKWQDNNPEKRRAHMRVQDALRSGRLTKQLCEVCAAEFVHAHHDDYSKPLDVVWLCPQHHADRHKEMRAAA